MQLDSKITPEIISFFNKSIKAIENPDYQEGGAVMGEIGSGPYFMSKEHPTREDELVVVFDGRKWIYSTSFILECFELSCGDTNWLNRFLLPAME